jgi:hypothetical protein
MDPLTLYAIERFLAIAIGGLAIVLGYRLFQQIPVKQGSSGEFKLPFDLSIGLTRVGPGAFFALFGAAVVGYSLHGAIQTHDTKAAGAVHSVDATGAMPMTAGAAGSLAARRLILANEIEFLNKLNPMLRNDLSAEEKRGAAIHATALKLGVMHSVWGEDWGDEAEFRDWADGGAPDPPPEGSKAAAAFFRTGLEGAQ